MVSHVGTRDKQSIIGHIKNITRTRGESMTVQEKSLVELSKRYNKVDTWTLDENHAFIEGIKRYGRKWKKISEIITSKTYEQIAAHT